MKDGNGERECESGAARRSAALRGGTRSGGRFLLVLDLVSHVLNTTLKWNRVLLRTYLLATARSPSTTNSGKEPEQTALWGPGCHSTPQGCKGGICDADSTISTLCDRRVESSPIRFHFISCAELPYFGHLVSHLLVAPVRRLEQVLNLQRGAGFTDYFWSSSKVPPSNRVKYESSSHPAARPRVDSSSKSCARAGAPGLKKMVFPA